VLGEQDEARLDAAIERMAGLAASGDLVEAARDWMTEWANEEEMAALAESGYLEACAKYVPVLLHMLAQADESDHTSPTDPSVLRQVTAPVLILQGSQSHATWPWFTKSVRHIAGILPDVSVREVAGAGHMGAWVEPAAVAEELIRFFEERLAAVRREGEQPAAR